ncbi:MAG: hypothetical protein IJ560_04640 [Alphaproteobacteria bacterium]|nr:hypothetical protein [Alphaproteobacteria bacterium]
MGSDWGRGIRIGNRIAVCALLCAICLGVGAPIGAYADCLKVFSVTYGCGDGTVNDSGDESVSTLPDVGGAGYGQSFTPATVTAAMCTPPAGKTWGGTQIGDSAGYTTTTGANGAAFTYMYTHNINVTPRYVNVGDMQNSNFTQKFLFDHKNTSYMSYCNKSHNRTVLYNGEPYYTAQRLCSDDVYNAIQPGEWAVKFPYGEVTGYAVCTNIVPQNTTPGYYTGYIADDQAAVQSVWDTWSATRPTTVAGPYCYCKLAGSALAGSPWVYQNVYGSTSLCADFCAFNCAFYVSYGAVFRGAVFSAVGD